MHATTFVVALSAAVLLVACSNVSDASRGPTQGTGVHDEAPFSWTAAEQQALDACTSEKLGYDFDFAVSSDAFSSRVDPDAETEWEDNRWIRAYSQCVVELHSDRYDFASPEYESVYRLAYGLDPDGNPVMSDPLAPWSREDPQ